MVKVILDLFCQCVHLFMVRGGAVRGVERW
jgi:hypothetical protein